MDPFSTLLYPLKYGIEAVLAGAHAVLTFFGLAANGGLVWVLSVLVLVILVRLALLPVALRLNTSQRLLATLRPEIKAINERYAKQLDDPEIRRKMLEETTALYKEAKANPLAPFIPIVVQVIIFLSLFQVLANANAGRAGVGLMTGALANSFSQASLFNVIPLADTIFNNQGNLLVSIVGAVILGAMVVMQVLTQRNVILANSVSGRMADTNRIERTLIFVAPVLSVVATFLFPLQILFYWLFSNLWTLVQQVLFSRYRPMPGSYAEQQHRERYAS